MVRQPGFFGVEERLALLSAKGDGLERLAAVVDFEMELRAAGYLAMAGQLVDATVVSAPEQRDTKAEKATGLSSGESLRVAFPAACGVKLDSRP